MVSFARVNVLLNFVTISNFVMKVQTNMEMSLFKKLAGNDVRITSTYDVITASSRLDCCVSCTNSNGCGLVNYNMLSLENNCELIGSGQSNISFVTSQSGWKVFVKNEAHACYYTADWYTVGSSCYKLETEKMSWHDSQARCALNKNGHLVHITSDDENKLMKNIFEMLYPNQALQDIWIGLNDEDVEGSFKWTDGTQLSATDFQNWASGQPNNHGGSGENCAHLSEYYGFDWNDQGCNAISLSMCEIDIV